MMPYKKIDDNLTTREFNGIVSLLRDNVRFHEDIQINTSNVNGAYGEYQFNFREATMLDNGVLITNQTLTTIGTVKLVNPAFPHSNYYLDLKVYSSEDIGVLDEEDVLVTPLTVKLVKDTEVNIPFETLEMNNIIGFDATVRIDHKDLVLNTGDTLELSCEFNKMFPTLSVPFKIRYLNEDLPVTGKTVSLYEGETLLGTGVTGVDGYATVEVSFTSLGTHTVTAKAGVSSSNNVSLEITNEGDMILEITGNEVRSYSGCLDFEGSFIAISWGDNTFLKQEEIVRFNHNYGRISDYTIQLIGTLTALNSQFFSPATYLNSVHIPSSVTRIRPFAFADCENLTSIELEWENSDDIIQYDNSWIVGCTSFQYFLIREGTKQLYLDKRYPSGKLKEDIAFDDLTLTSDKDILSYNGGTNPDTATLTAQLTYEGEPALVEGETVTFEVRKQSDDSLVETLSDVTDSSGVATVSYTSKGAGDLYIKSECSLVSKTYEIQDCDFFADGSIVPSSVTISSGASFTSNGSYLTLTTDTSGQKNVYYPTTLTNSDDWLFEVELAHIGVSQHITTSNDNGNYFNVNPDGGGLLVWKFNDESGNHTQSKSVSVGDKFRWEYKNGTLYYYHNDTLIASKTQTFTNPLKFISYTNRDGSTSRVQHLKNIKLKLL